MGYGSTAEEARLELVHYTLDGNGYGLPLRVVERILPMVAISPLPKAPPIVLGVVNVHGTVIPVVDLRRRFGLPSRDYGLGGRLLLARTSRRLLAFPVDEVLGVSEVPAEDVSPPEAVLPGIGQVAGIVRLAGGLLLIQDLDACLALDEERQLDAALGEGRS